MPFELPPLPYAYNALEPHIDEMTMRIHHDRHHGAYVTNVNKALESAPDLQAKAVHQLLRDLNAVPEAVRCLNCQRLFEGRHRQQTRVL